MRKKRFMAFLLSLAMAGTSVYTCGVIDVQAAAIENQEAGNPNLEQLAEEIQAQAADMTDNEVADPISEQMDEPEAQASAGPTLQGVTDGKIEWGNTVTANASCSFINDKGEIIATGTTFTPSENDIERTITASANGEGTQFYVEKRTLTESMITVSAGEIEQYTGEAQRPSVVVSDNAVGKRLDPEGEYITEYYDNTDVGDARVLVFIQESRTHRNAAEDVEKTFKIAKRTITSVNLTTEWDEYPYTGASIRPRSELTASGNGRTNIPMVEGRDYTITWTDNVSVGDKPTATFAISSNGFFVGKSTPIVGAFKITPKEGAILTGEFSDREVGNFSYGTSLNAIKKLVVVSDGSLHVDEADYTLELQGAASGNADVLGLGNYTLKITGSGNYASSSTGKVDFSIVGPSISEDDIEIEVISADQISYNGGEPLEPELNVKVWVVSGDDNERVSVNLTKEEEYIVNYKNNTEAALSTDDIAPTAIVTVKEGNYAEHSVSKAVSFNINPASISANNVSANAAENPVYIGGPQKPEKITVSADFQGKNGVVNKVLVENVDYTISEGSYLENISAGDKAYKVRVIASGNYTGYKDIEYKIVPKDLGDKEIIWKGLRPSYGYTGSQISPNFTLEYASTVSTDNLVLSMNRDYGKPVYGDNISMNRGGTITVTGSGNYTGTKEYKFDITRRNITDAKQTKAVSYNGQAISADDYITVSSDDRKLTFDNDYTFIYPNGEPPTNAGTYILTVSGTNDYAGTRYEEVEFTIDPRPLSGNVTVTCSGASTFKGGWKGPEITVSDSDSKIGVLSVNTDYTASATQSANNRTTGHYVVTAVPNGNYSGEVSGNFAIGKTDLNKISLNVTCDITQVYDGEHHRPGISEITVTDVTNSVSLNSEDIYISGYDNNVNAGEAIIRLNARSASDYTGLVTASFRIEARDLNASDIVMLSDNKVIEAEYTGQPEVLSADDLKDNCLSYNGNVLSANDYEIIFKKDGKEVTEYEAVGEYSIIAKGKNNFQGEREIGIFKVNPAPLNKDNFILNPESSEYTGEPQTTEVRVVRNAYGPEDYKVTYPEEMVSVGDYKIKVSGQGNYKGDVELDFTITKVTLTDENTDIIYSGVSENDPEMVMIDVNVNGRRLTQGVDYTYTSDSVSGADPKAWRVTITASGNNYQGSLTKRVDFEPIVLADDDVKVLKELIYTGEEQTLSPNDIEVTRGGKTLAEGIDYEVVSGSEHPATNCGEYATLSVNGKGEYTGAATALAPIKAYTLVSDNVVEVQDVLYTEEAVAPEVTVKGVGGKTLTLGTDYTVEIAESNVLPGDYTATVRGMGNYAGAVEVSYRVTTPSLDNAVIDEVNYTYTGSVQKPAKEDLNVTVYGQKVPDSQYDIVSYENEDSVNVGRYSFIISGQGVYEGTATGYYNIVEKKFEDAVVTAEDVVYTGAKAEPKVTVTLDGQELVRDVDYIVNTGDAVDAKKGYTLSVIGINNYAGTKEATFNINPKAITAQNVKVTTPSSTYNGSAQKPKSATVTVDNIVLTANDFNFAVADNAVNAGNVNVTITGKGNYTGTVKGAWFTIEPRDISKGRVSGIVNKTYTGKAIAQSPTVTIDGKKLTKAARTFKITYKNNKNIGLASLTIVGQGNYKGQISARTFKISPVKATIKSLKGGSKRFTVQAKSQKGGVSYQIQYRVKGASGYTRIETKNPKKVIKGLRKGKTYAVRIRAYKKVNGTMYYGAFSKAKNVKVK